MSDKKPQPPDDLPTYVVDPIERQNPDILELIREYIDDLLAYHRALEAQELAEDELTDEGEELVDVEEQGSGAIVTKMIPCGKDNCSTCPHGPYDYRVTREGDTVNWEYIGKSSNI